MHATEIVSSIKFTEALAVCISELYYFQSLSFSFIV
jgi:hypothetical protein